MFAAIAALGPWTWIIAGLALMLIELFAPGLFFIWLGLAALATGVVVGAFGLGWTTAAMLFTAFAVGSVLAGRMMLRRSAAEPETATGLNAMSRDLVGRIVRLDEGFQNGKGRIRIGDTVWQAFGDGLDAGDQVRIVRIEGSALVVERTAST